MASALWDSWMGKEKPAALLHRIDQDIQAGLCKSRRIAFEDYAWKALEKLLLPAGSHHAMAIWLAERLLWEAEQEEDLLLIDGEPVLEGGRM